MQIVIQTAVLSKRGYFKTNEKEELRGKLRDFLIAKALLVPSLEEADFYKIQSGSVFMDREEKGKRL